MNAATKAVRIIRKGIIKNYYRNNNRNQRIWVFGEWFGNRGQDNSMFLGNYIAANKSGIDLYWIANDNADLRGLDSSIKVLRRGSNEAKHILTSCGVAVVSQSLEDLAPEGFNYVEGAVSILLWHGIPWKMIGHDGQHTYSWGSKLYAKMLDYVNSISYYASPSDEFDNVLETAFNVKKNRIIHAGYPRNSGFYSASDVAAKKQILMNEISAIVPDRNYGKSKVIVYMPTFRNYTHDNFSFKKLLENKRFKEFVEDEDIIIIQKAHYVNQTRDGQNQVNSYERIFNLNNIAAQELLAAADLLITDYSGAFFDYTLLDRPIVHYLYDYKRYKEEDRGLYYEKDDVVAGAIAENEEELVSEIIRNLQEPSLYSERRAYVRSRFLKYESDKSCELLYQAILERLKRKM